MKLIQRSGSVDKHRGYMIKDKAFTSDLTEYCQQSERTDFQLVEKRLISNKPLNAKDAFTSRKQAFRS